MNLNDLIQYNTKFEKQAQDLASSTDMKNKLVAANFVGPEAMVAVLNDPQTNKVVVRIKGGDPSKEEELSGYFGPNYSFKFE